MAGPSGINIKRAHHLVTTKTGTLNEKCQWEEWKTRFSNRYSNDGFGGLVVSMLASGTQDRGFDPGRSRRIFRAKKSTACLPWGGK